MAGLDDSWIWVAGLDMDWIGRCGDSARVTATAAMGMTLLSFAVLCSAG